ncbi:MAG: hypothetical protein AAGH65_03190 [Pseudomonadota bacterium]
MARKRRPRGRNGQQRQHIAIEAARILATDGQRNYRLAKEKAALRLGLDPSTGLPSNTEVEQALRDHQQLYQVGHAEILQRKRRAALNAMRFFSDFRPRLVGTVLEGTADQHSRISLHLFCDTPDQAVAFLLLHKLPFEQETRRIRWHDGNVRELELIVVEADEETFELALMAGPGWRQPPPSPVDGKAQRRAGVAAVEALLDSAVGALP